MTKHKPAGMANGSPAKENPGLNACRASILTPECRARLEKLNVALEDYLLRHRRGDWGIASASDVAQNEKALIEAQAGRPGQVESVFLLPDKKTKLIVRTSFLHKQTACFLEGEGCPPRVPYRKGCS